MACPKCGCKEVYDLDSDGPFDDLLQRCAACGHVFDLYDEAEEPDDAVCAYCHGDGGDPGNDYLLPCPKCGGSGA